MTASSIQTSEQSACDNLHSLRGLAGAVYGQVFDALDQCLTLQQLSKDHVLAIEPRSLCHRDEELRGKADMMSNLPAHQSQLAT